MKKYFLLVVVLCLGLASTAFGQVTSTTGGIDGRVEDPQGAAVAGAKVTIVGPSGVPVTLTTTGDGSFQIQNVPPGYYTVTVEQTGFKTTKIEKVEVVVGKSNPVTAKLEVGEQTAVVNITDVAQIDQGSTAGGANLSDQLYQNIPVARSVSSLFYLSAGVTTGLGAGNDNPSISGGSALDNLYVADGVNITDSAFGGIGTFARTQGALGTGINTSYIKEVQVKTSGFEPQYGQSTGGIVNIITKSGGNDFHGAVYAYARPQWLEATRRQRDEFSINKVGQINHQEFYDAGVDFSGPVVKDKLFFFGSFNPSVRRDIVEGAHRSAFQLANGAAARIDSGLFNLLGENLDRYRTLNYSFKLDWTINSNHSMGFSLFGDPSKTNRGPGFGFLNIDNTTALASLDYGTRNLAVRYNGAFGTSNPATLSVTFSRNDNHFDEFGFDNVYNILNRTDPVPLANSSAFILNNTRGNYNLQGYGFFEPTTGKTYRFTIDGTKQKSFLGTHSFGIGYQFQKAFYSGLRDRSGPKFPIPAFNAAGEPTTDFGLPPEIVGQLSNATFGLRLAGNSCTLCPLYFVPSDNTNPTGFGAGWRRVSLQQSRGEFGNTSFDTFANYHAAYISDTWRFNKYITALLGLRWEQEQVQGSVIDAQAAAIAGISSSFVGTRTSYTFTGQWSPRLGVTIDPMGKGKTKVFYNFARYHEYLPLDAAERSLSIEEDFLGARFAPDFRIGTAADGPRAGQRIAIINSLNSVVAIPDSAHTLCGAPGGIAFGGSCFFGFGANDPTQVVFPGTKLGYLDEHVVGFEQQLPRNFTLSAKYIDRRIKRVIEDAAILPPEGYQIGLGQTYFLGNINSTLDAGINLDEIVNPTPAQLADPGICAIDGDVFGAGNGFVPIGHVCFGPTGISALGATINRPDGIPDGFPDPKRIYKALEVEVNKRFSDNWQLLSNVRFASLRGNYEGHLRNDNGQTDPGISSLFDFTGGQFDLLGDQFAVGSLPTDRRVVANIYGSYTLGKEGFGNMLHGMTLGANLHGESGIPITLFLAHPAYQNSGEIPSGGRGALGRTSPYYRLDLHLDYPWMLSETTKVSFIADFFNVTNNRAIQRVNEFKESTFGQLNPDFFAPRTFYAPFNLRLGVRLEF
jgi:hypothetical protein